MELISVHAIFPYCLEARFVWLIDKRGGLVNCLKCTKTYKVKISEDSKTQSTRVGEK